MSGVSDADANDSSSFIMYVSRAGFGPRASTCRLSLTHCTSSLTSGRLTGPTALSLSSKVLNYGNSPAGNPVQELTHCHCLPYRHVSYAKFLNWCFDSQRLCEEEKWWFKQLDQTSQIGGKFEQLKAHAKTLVDEYNGEAITAAVRCWHETPQYFGADHVPTL